jgi:hypothetical protein
LLPEEAEEFEFMPVKTFPLCGGDIITPSFEKEQKRFYKEFTPC